MKTIEQVKEYLTDRILSMNKLEDTRSLSGVGYTKRIALKEILDFIDSSETENG